MEKLVFSYLCLILAATCQARIITVDNDGPADFNNIQAAIDANDTKDGDRILVALGEYIINEPITYRGKNITLKSEEGAEKTIINGNYQTNIFIFNSGETNEAVLEGFTIVKGKFYPYSGGIHCQESSPTIKYNIITKNEASEGGGIACLKANPLIIFNIITKNIGDERGGGIYCEDSKVLILGNIIKENSVWDTAGGGILCRGDSSVIIRGNYIIDNFAYESDGGIGYVATRGSQAFAIIENNIIARNRTYEFGGGIYFSGNGIIIGNTIVQNFASHGGGGIFGHPDDCLVLLNNIIHSNTPTDLSGIQPSQVFYSNISQEGFAGINGNICTDPLFADPNNNDYHLKSQAGRWDANEGRWTKDEVTSLCIDAGDPTSPIGLEPFPNGGIINMGAYGGTIEASKSYFGEPVCEIIVAGDINGDCKVDFKDFALMAFHWLEER
jgi:hypothetical protein